MIEAIKAALPLEAVLHDAGVELRHGKSLCPFHADKTPSFSVRGDRWRCFAGCGGGDMVDFVAKYHGLDVHGAVKLLAERAGIRSPRTREERQAAEEARRRREHRAELIRAFRAWEQAEVNDLADLLRRYRHLTATRHFTNEVELETLAELQGNIDIHEYHYSILCGRDDEAKFTLFREGFYG